MPDSKKPSNLKTALILASIALAFMASIFIKRLWLS
ncbi:MAG TPA: cytochrome oxidase small assembly protein [Paucimonas sp.]|nr:cytochrome oxidase small assembly protein [Paucimonas sp.]HJW56431.1 cytochrome oxidase small assembly protein [Burkholderiaceae bacterium]